MVSQSCGAWLRARAIGYWGFLRRRPRPAAESLKAMKWYRIAAQQGDVTAQATLGLIYYTGRGVPENPWQAAEWYLLAAEQGNITAQAISGTFMRKAVGSRRTMYGPISGSPLRRPPEIQPLRATATPFLCR